MALQRLWLAVAISVLVQAQDQSVFESPQRACTPFHHHIQRVAVVGAGPAGLQAAAKLVEHNFTVRLFERAPHPGGNWLYSDEIPVRESYPDDSIRHTAEVPTQLPTTRYYNEGDDGIPLDESLHTNSPKVSTELPDVKYDPESPWVLSHHAIQRHVRSYASHHCLSSIDHCPSTPDAVPVASYSTRVERVEKNEEAHTWVLTLRRLKRMQESERILEEWWTETFDAVVLAAGPYTAAHVPDIDGIVDWSKAKEGGQGGQYSVYHSQSYRHPERYAGKTVLIVGASVSASEIARDIHPFAHRIIASIRPPTNHDGGRQRSLARFPNTTEFVPEIASFEPLKKHTAGIQQGKIHLIDESIVQGIDEIILATGFRGHALYPHNSTTRRPDNIYWTGHYIPDPTLAYTIGRPWTMGRYQSYGFAKVWEGTACLPPPKSEIPDPISEGSRGGEAYWRQMWLGEAVFRRYITWLNDASLKYGGRFVQPPPVENVELLKYYSVVHFLNNSMVQLNGSRFDISALSMDLRDDDPWNALIDEGSDW
ncbi:FAD/NAD-P-binding domain-containing protein [Mycena vitilis]|nr:FAD/NAD-P-binding domain-containing protein [Mycena vitilis]